MLAFGQSAPFPQWHVPHKHFQAKCQVLASSSLPTSLEGPPESPASQMKAGLVQGLKTCMSTCLCAAWGTLSYIFYRPTTAQYSPSQPQLVQLLLWKYKQDKKENVSEFWVGMKYSIITYELIWFPELCATGGFASSILLPASLSHWPTTLQKMLGHPCLTKTITKGP